MRPATIWLVTFCAYVGSAVVNQRFQHLAPTPTVVFAVGLGLFFLGPVVAAWRFGLPPLPLLALLAPAYYVLIALSVSDYDEPRWSYGRFWSGVFLVLLQAIPALIVAAVARPRRTRPLT